VTIRLGGAFDQKVLSQAKGGNGLQSGEPAMTVAAADVDRRGLDF
jgi:hypothetical protein